MFFVLLQILLALIVGFFLLLVVLEERSIRASGRAKKARLEAADAARPLPDERLPVVSVLLPVYNEKLVVEKLVDAVCSLDYPPNALEILLLDDSTDETRELAAACVAGHQAHGVPIHYARREKRIGYKAGNLNFGLTMAKGEFIAVFDADCLPPPDFLRKTMPFFEDAKVGFLQTGIDYANRSASFLTRFQAMEAGHKEDVTTGLARDGFMASLTGSSCVWRRQCIEAVGGISADTITEDVDMGYKAQLDAWKYVFLRDVVSLAELPESMGAFRVQRQRWARGLIHNALRHAQSMWATRMPLLSRLYAVSLMFSSLLPAAIYVLLLLCLPMAFMTDPPGLFFHLCCTLFLLTAGVWAWSSTAGQDRSTGAPSALRRRVCTAVGYILMFFPVSLYYFTAAVQIFAGIKGDFHRTPKGCGRGRVRHPSINTWLGCLEAVSLFYALIVLCVSLERANYWIFRYSMPATGGFAMALFFSWSGHRKKTEDHPRHVCITGASGALGGAFALEYAAPGVRLTLHGRRANVLEQLAEQCRAKGAQVDLKILDLRRRDAVRRWMKDLCAQDVPDLLIANAGLNAGIGPDAGGEPFEEAAALVEVNLLAVMASMDGALPAFRKRGSGQIALMSSLAAYYGLPATPTYCATKAALKIYGEALRGRLAPEGIRINVVMPGYVDSAMCAAMPGPKPFLWTPQRAARAVRRGLERDRAVISFPFPLNLGIRGLSMLPACLAVPIVRLLGYGTQSGRGCGPKSGHVR
jgi:cellulose synthase/poly-beta-1,6-N-acetylglucosamine synthase-like glycosyltransferase/short-subunit dehydrogenase